MQSLDVTRFFTGTFSLSFAPIFLAASPSKKTNVKHGGKTWKRIPRKIQSQSHSPFSTQADKKITFLPLAGFPGNIGTRSSGRALWFKALSREMRQFHEDTDSQLHFSPDAFKLLEEANIKRSIPAGPEPSTCVQL